MSRQINLLNPAFRKVRDWLTAAPVAIVACLLLTGIASGAVLTRSKANHLLAIADQQAGTLKSAQDQLVTLTKAAAEGKPDPKLVADLANARAMLKGREEVMKILEAGTVGNISGFSEYLRGFARQTPQGLWLTGFTIGAGGGDMEIRGRMLDPSALPEYIHRLNSEKVFQGRSFSALTIKRPDEGQSQKNAATARTASQPPYVEFVLKPGSQTTGTPADLAGSEGATPPESKP
ncbi:MAG: PilN domain-containing protein [Betaproteobacteria bacterium]|nr:PilN domain-containing protein [Betaproteobacteria bacterium]